MKKKIINIGIVGCGRVFEHYVKIFNRRKTNDFKIHVVCDKEKNSSNLAEMLRLSLFAFLSSGAALSSAYNDLFFSIVGMTVALSVVVDNQIKEKEKLRDDAMRRRAGFVT